ncbi:MAG: YdcH family protein [Sphingobium sp.]
MENSYISALSAKHAGLDARIRAEASRPMPDATLMASLKKQKLRLKEEMTAHSGKAH